MAQVRWGSVKKLFLENVLSMEEKMFKEATATEQLALNLIESNKTKKVAAELKKLTQSMYETTSSTWKSMENKFWQYFWTGF